ncbi:hypothetical protein [Ensifer sp. LCM 4579]|uniref:hypothetical protein n=1 Tax=Ensifer sp. LCM 4579 TaxID=1848292 RepID=UPI00104213C3|nr:hypothetical protein [Ensifer sp. LCM 4579]
MTDTLVEHQAPSLASAEAQTKHERCHQKRCIAQATWEQCMNNSILMMRAITLLGAPAACLL